MVTRVSDSASNSNEQIEHAARAIGHDGHKRKVFEAAYYHKSRTKTVAQIAERSGLTRKQVLNAAAFLVKKCVLEDAKLNGEKAYTRIEYLHAHKSQILKLASNGKALAAFPTKRKQASVTVNVVKMFQAARAAQLTVDDLPCFRSVRDIPPDGFLPATISETTFKRGIQQILGEPGEFKDWGGEQNDLLSTRLSLSGRRRTVAFAFKGPGTKGRLVPGKMGKNGDQIQRLLTSPAEVFLLQYWRDIDQSVLLQMQLLARAIAASGNRKIWFGIIDGADSWRICRAFPSHFGLT